MSDYKAEFFEKYAAAAIEEQKRYGIPASVTLAQMAVESGYGESSLARQDNNYFGIKASDKWIKAGKPGAIIMTTIIMTSSAPFPIRWKAWNTIPRY